MAKLLLDPNDTFPLAQGTSNLTVFASSGAETLTVNAGSDVELSGFQTDADDTVQVAGAAGDYTVQASGSTTTLTDGNTTIELVAGLATGIQFDDTTIDLSVDTTGVVLGSHTVTGTANTITAKGDGNGNGGLDGDTGGGDGGGDGTGISLPTGQGEVTETATNEAETFTLDLQAAAATGDNTQIILEGFSAQEDTLQFDFDNQFIPSVQVDSLDDLDDVAVNTGGDQADVSSNPITDQTTVTLGMNGSGDAIALTLAGITEPAGVEAEVV